MKMTGERRDGREICKAVVLMCRGLQKQHRSFAFLLIGCQTVLSPTASEPDTILTKTSPKSSLKGDKDPGEESEAVDGKLSIFIHKREDQSSHEVLQPLLR